ncbi:apoptosis-inducing factor 3 isoform X2 [Venturia canescens]|uniref:apoptosis-inducing factor 3 isoform X2 n=1 Tax=Venturia canescens TaxID=32260 RepID=UPI001C9D0F8B|nr:apoptosis-inducing factor 3 isoform X2 [Venturia canescens]
MGGKSEKLDYVEDVVCNESDINDNEMKLLPLGDDGGKILLIKQKGELHAIGTKCTHYGALLHTGALGDGRIRCPWHGACFNIKTGDIEDYPGLDSLPCYKVSVDNGQVKVQAKRKDLEANRRIKGMCSLRKESPKTVVIVGGGPAAATCAESLRQEGFDGRIVMICKENVLPYDRIKVSKTMDMDVQKILLRPQMFYDENKIETKLGVEATALNTAQNIVKLSNNEELKYDNLFIATGSKARMPDAPGSNLTNIFVLRDYTDAARVHQKLSSDKHVVILGQSFIGMEAAAYCAGKCAEVTVIGRDKVPLKAVFGEDIGDRVKQEHEKKGIKFIDEMNIARFIAKDDGQTLGQVELTNGVLLQADIAIVGIGSTFYTDWLKDSALELMPNGSVIVDKNLRTTARNVFAGGDIACAPVFAAQDISAAIGHWPLAHYHGKIAALNIVGKETPLRAVPFFWTMLFGKGYRYAGFGRATSHKIYGSLSDLKYFAYYFNEGRVIAMSSCGTDPIVSDFAEYLHEGKTLTEAEVTANPTGWMRNKPKDLDKLLSASKTVLSASHSIGALCGSQQRKAYHTLAVRQRDFCKMSGTFERITHCKKMFKYAKFIVGFRI